MQLNNTPQSLGDIYSLKNVLLASMEALIIFNIHGGMGCHKIFFIVESVSKVQQWF